MDPSSAVVKLNELHGDQLKVETKNIIKDCLNSPKKVVRLAALAALSRLDSYETTFFYYQDAGELRRELVKVLHTLIHDCDEDHASMQTQSAFPPPDAERIRQAMSPTVYVSGQRPGESTSFSSYRMTHRRANASRLTTSSIRKRTRDGFASHKRSQMKMGAGEVRCEVLRLLAKLPLKLLEDVAEPVVELLLERFDEVVYSDPDSWANVTQGALRALSRFESPFYPSFIQRCAPLAHFENATAAFENRIVDLLSSDRGRVRAACFLLAAKIPGLLANHPALLAKRCNEEEPLVYEATQQAFQAMPLAEQAWCLIFFERRVYTAPHQPVSDSPAVVWTSKIQSAPRPSAAVNLAPLRAPAASSNIQSAPKTDELPEPATEVLDEQLNATLTSVAERLADASFKEHLASFAGVIPLRYPSLRQQALDALRAAPDALWACALESGTKFQRPSQLEPALPIMRLLKSAPLTLSIWRTVAPAAQLMLERIIEVALQSETAVETLTAVYNHERLGSLKNYYRQLGRVRTEATYFEYQYLMDDIAPKIERRNADCVQSYADFPTLYASAAARKPKLDAFLQKIATLTGAQAQMAPLKGGWRALEKMTLSAEHKAGAGLDATRICDCLRGALNCKSFVEIVSIVDLLQVLDKSLSGDEEAERAEMVEKEYAIRILRLKDRFKTPTSGGWADLLINFVFVDDKDQHVMELQVQHETLLRVRKEGNAHEKYNIFRTAFEVLEAIGKPPQVDTDVEAQLEKQQRSFLLDRQRSSMQSMHFSEANLQAGGEPSRSSLTMALSSTDDGTGSHNVAALERRVAELEKRVEVLEGRSS